MKQGQLSKVAYSQLIQNFWNKKKEMRQEINRAIPIYYDDMNSSPYGATT